MGLGVSQLRAAVLDINILSNGDLMDQRDIQQLYSCMTLFACVYVCFMIPLAK